MAVRGAESLMSDQPGGVAGFLASEKRARLGRRERACLKACARLRTTPGAALQPLGTRMTSPGWSLTCEDRDAHRAVAAARPLGEGQLGLRAGVRLDHDETIGLDNRR